MTEVEPTVLLDCYVEIDGHDLSTFANKATINTEYEDLDATTFGVGAKRRRGGIEDGSIDIGWLNDYTATTGLDDIMWGLRGTVVPFKIRPTSDAKGVSNPEWTGNILINKWTGISGDVGKLSAADSSFPTSGVTTRATS
jgi:hypothetical protein